jgi:rhodanese-related sulfurtransferase
MIFYRSAFFVLFLGVFAILNAALAENMPTNAKDIYERIKAKEFVLVDIRRPSEWKTTGVAEQAVPITMHNKDFIANLDKLVNGDRSKKIAIICAHGNRSKFVQKALPQYGYKNIVEVNDGMEGGHGGPGWIKSGLPVKEFTTN